MKNTQLIKNPPDHNNQCHIYRLDEKGNKTWLGWIQITQSWRENWFQTLKFDDDGQQLFKHELKQLLDFLEK